MIKKPRVFDRGLFIIGMFLVLGLLELYHIHVMFAGTELLAGGDNYTFLQFFKGEIKPYIWDSSYIPLGGVAFYLPYIFSVPLYSKLLSFVSYGVAQRIVLFLLFMLRYVALVKLLTYISKKTSVLALFPILMFYGFNVFESLNPFSLFPLMYSVYFPFCLYYFVKLFDSEKIDLVTIAKLVFLSIVFVPLNANVALSITIFLPIALYVLLNIRIVNKIKIINIFLYGCFYLGANFWWLFALAIYYIQSAENVLAGGWFSATSAGNLSQNFRLIGQWGWYGSHYLKAYYPFNNYYDLPIILLSTFIPVVIAFYEGFRKDSDSRLNSFKTFLILISLVGLFFISGTRPPFGVIYQFLYDHFFILKIFREPFTKFAEIHVLATVSLCYLFLLNLSTKLTVKQYFIVCVFATLIVFLNIKPVFMGDHVISSWNGSVRSMRTNIPQYWKDFEAYSSRFMENARILTLPKVYYGAAWNWASGFTAADDVAVNFVHNGNSVLRGSLNNGTISSPLINNIFGKNKLTKNYLALLGVDHLLQENDLDWRYSGDGTLSPSLTTTFINKLNVQPVISFGVFDKDYLTKIPNKEPTLGLKNYLYYELLDKNILNLFALEKADTLPLFYVPTYTVYSVNDPINLQNTLNAGDYATNSQFFLKQTKRFSKDLVKIADEVTIVGVPLPSKINFSTHVWSPSWSWPTPSVSPTSRKYILVSIKERFSLLVQDTTASKIDSRIWLGAKRIAELEKYELHGVFAQDNLKKALELFRQAIELIEPDFPTDKQVEYWELNRKVYSYLQRAVSILQKMGYAELELADISQLYDNYYKNLLERTRNGCVDACYIFEIPQDGIYTLTNANNSLTEPLKENLKLGSGDIYKLNYKEESPRYILELDKITKNNVAQFIKLIEWNPGATYKLTFDYKIKYSDFDVTVLEDKVDYSSFKTADAQVTQRKKLFNQNFTESRICLDKNDTCFSHFERFFTASADAKGGSIYIILPAEDAPNSSAEIINIKIEAYVEPLLVLKLRNATVEKAAAPTVTFKKINPTKYEIYVTNATAPYSLVFNESFSKFWKLRLVDDTKSDYYSGTNYIITLLNRLIASDKLFANLSYKSITSSEIARTTHTTANSYANSWYIVPSAVQDKQNYTLIAEFSLQKYLCIFLVFMLVIFVISCGVILVEVSKNLWKKSKS